MVMVAVLLCPMALSIRRMQESTIWASRVMSLEAIIPVRCMEEGFLSLPLGFLLTASPVQLPQFPQGWGRGWPK